MEKRVLVAVLLMSAVILLTNLLFPPPEEAPVAEPEERAAPAAVVPAPAPPVVVQEADVPARVVTVRSPLYRYAFSTRGAALTGAELLEYASYVDRDEPVQLVPEGVADFLAHRLVVGGDTLDLRRLPFQVSAPGLELGEGAEPQALRFTYTREGLGVEITYTFRPDSYLVGVSGRVTGVGAGAELLTGLGPGLATRDAPHEIAVVALQGDDLERLPFDDVQQPEVMAGPLSWVGVKDKYFLAALVAGAETPFRTLVVRPLPDARIPVPGEEDPLVVPRADAVAALPLGGDGAFAFGAYLGPQEYDRLAAVGYELEDVTQYGYAWLRPVVRPIAAATLWVLGILHVTLGVSLGWALIIFGVLVKLALWPLNAKAMRAQMRNMAVQPLLKEIQTQYKDQPERLQQEMVKLYKEHGFNPLAGCLPLLLPMPIFITLFFVFQNAIAFRGAEFWWLPDLSLPDPYYILPVLFIASIFVTQLISTKMAGMEMNPQMKMMMYVMPLVMGFFFFTFAAGLNLYYVASNVAGVPQQMLIARERRRAQEKLDAEKASAPKATAGPARPQRAKRKR